VQENATLGEGTANASQFRVNVTGSLSFDISTKDCMFTPTMSGSLSITIHQTKFGTENETKETAMYKINTSVRDPLITNGNFTLQSLLFANYTSERSAPLQNQRLLVLLRANNENVFRNQCCFDKWTLELVSDFVEDNLCLDNNCTFGNYYVDFSIPNASCAQNGELANTENI